MARTAVPVDVAGVVFRAESVQTSVKMAAYCYDDGLDDEDSGPAVPLGFVPQDLPAREHVVSDAGGWPKLPVGEAEFAVVVGSGWKAHAAAGCESGWEFGRL